MSSAADALSKVVYTRSGKLPQPSPKRRRMGTDYVGWTTAIAHGLQL